MEKYPTFPKLKRLSLSDESTRIAISDLEITRFPALREIFCGPVIEGDVALTPKSMMLKYPPLQVLAVTTKGNTAWLDLLIGCRNSLVSLKLYFESPFPTTSNLVLPMLKCLEIILWIPDPDGWPTDLKTPLIETYIESRSYGGGLTVPIHRDIGSVRQMCLDRDLNLSAATLLRILQLENDSGILIILAQLQSSPDLCPDLEVIEVTRSGIQAFFFCGVKERDIQRSQPILLENVTKLVRSLPFAIVQSPVSIQSGISTPTNGYYSVDQECPAGPSSRRMVLFQVITPGRSPGRSSRVRG